MIYGIRSFEFGIVAENEYRLLSTTDHRPASTDRTTGPLCQLESRIVHSIVIIRRPCCQIQQVVDAGSVDRQTRSNGKMNWIVDFFLIHSNPESECT